MGEGEEEWVSGEGGAPRAREEERGKGGEKDVEEQLGGQGEIGRSRRTALPFCL